jgi:hypothetical protein
MKLNFKRKSLISLVRREEIVYKENMNASQRVLAEELAELGYLDKHSGAWSGKTFFTLPDCRIFK